MNKIYKLMIAAPKLPSAYHTHTNIRINQYKITIKRKVRPFNRKERTSNRKYGLWISRCREQKRRTAQSPGNDR